MVKFISLSILLTIPTLASASSSSLRSGSKPHASKENSEEASHNLRLKRMTNDDSRNYVRTAILPEEEIEPKNHIKNGAKDPSSPCQSTGSCLDMGKILLNDFDEEALAEWERLLIDGSLSMDPNAIFCNNTLTSDGRREEIRTKLLEFTDASDLDDPESPQGKAFAFIVDVDPLLLCANDTTLPQRYVMTVFYYSTNGDDWNRCFNLDLVCADSSKFRGSEPFLSGESECTWAGLTCNPRGFVRDVELPDNGLSGTLPSEIGVLPDLDVIGLEDNAIEGTLPPSFNRGLFRLRLTNNLFGGSVGALPETLIALSLDSNLFTGTLQPMFDSVPRMRVLLLNSNQFSGPIPPSMSNMTGLTAVRMNGNSLTGEIPASVCDLRVQNPAFSVLAVDCSEVLCECCVPSCF